jgi:2-polyprenyl-3-methyl-5-hydroxy-6-metoxy-1,4-benzoquinol methylase
MTTSPCAVCHAQPVTPAYNGPIRDGAFGRVIPATITRCETCGLERLEDVQLSADYYTGDAYRKDLEERPDVAGYFERHDHEQFERLGLLKSIPLRGAVVADVGCAGGSFLDSISGFAGTTIGVDPAEAYHSSLRSRGHEVYGTLDAAIEKWRGRVDAVFCFSVIEHVEDPVGLLTGLRGLLRKGGTALVSTPNRDDILMRLGCEAYRSFFYRKVHRFYFDGASLSKAAATAGFSDTQLRFVHRFGHANFTKWLLHGRPGGETESPLGIVFDQTWRATLEDRGLADYLYGYLRA